MQFTTVCEADNPACKGNWKGVDTMSGTSRDPSNPLGMTE